MAAQNVPFGFVYDERMLQHECQYDSTMAECPKRMKLIYERLENDGLLDDAKKIEAREATDEELLLNHPQQLINEIKNLEDEKCEEYCKDKEILWTCESTNEAARVAAGGSIEIVKAVVKEQIHNGFAIVRPPGHHSYGNTPRGYCIFNNAAISAKYALEHLGVKRVAIVDFDYHAGNGTYESVKDDSRIHFTSIHAHHYGAFWPFSTTYDYATKDQNTLFVPLNGSMNTEGDYVSVFHHILLPMLRQFKPELILISAGFDAGYFDVMMDFGQGVKAHGYAHMARLLNEICPGKVVAVLEGGYFPRNYIECAAMMVRGLKGVDIPELHLPQRMSGALVETVWNILNHHAKWYPELASRLEKVIEQQQKLGLSEPLSNQTIFLGEKMRKLYDDMMKLNIVKTREWFPELDEEQVELCTEKIEEYVKNYKFTSKHSTPTENELIRQCLWDSTTRTNSFLESVPFTNCLIKEFNDFVEGRIQSMMICDRVMYFDAVEKGKLEKHDIIVHSEN